jgi:hypothetical protein
MRTALKSAALCIAILAMTLRAALPDGWMPSTQAEAAPIMLCPGMNDMTAMPAMAGMERNTPPQKQHHDQNHPSTFCLCAAIAQLGAPVDNVHALISAPASIEIAFDVAHDTPFLARSYAPNAARAPPVLV